jgi:hypothetical protein
MCIRVDERGMTLRQDNGVPNANVCLHSDAESFFDFYLSRLGAPSVKRTSDR